MDSTQILTFLDAVKDPEIPMISVVDLGIIGEVEQSADGGWTIEMIPTFAGCPALDVMKKDILDVLQRNGEENVKVRVNYTRPWSSNYVTPRGKRLLKDFGLSPPPAFDGMVTLDVLQNALCPKCGSTNTQLMNPFGPTACRAIHHCKDCLETFEQFKPV